MFDNVSDSNLIDVAIYSEDAAIKRFEHLLKKAKEININKLLLVCDTDNIGSEKTILKNGGIFEKTITIIYKFVIYKKIY